VCMREREVMCTCARESVHAYLIAIGACRRDCSARGLVVRVSPSCRSDACHQQCLGPCTYRMSASVVYAIPYVSHVCLTCVSYLYVFVCRASHSSGDRRVRQTLNPKSET
jgi:hypothetical protein